MIFDLICLLGSWNYQPVYSIGSNFIYCIDDDIVVNIVNDINFNDNFELIVLCLK